MNKHYGLIKLSIMIGLGLLVGCGRFWFFRMLQEDSLQTSVVSAAYYGVFLAVMVYFLMDLVMARGLIQFKNRALMVLSVLLIVLTVAETIWNDLILSNFNYYFYTKAVISSVLFIYLIGKDLSIKVIRVLNSEGTLPEKYLRKRPLKSFIELIFRLFPHAEPIGLYKIGDPGARSPVYVTGNFELTIRKVVRALRGNDCWLLVCDSRGINIWCATEAMHFGSENVIEAIETTKLAEKIETRKIVLPQLIAANFNLEDLKRKTGFAGIFGPVNINDIEIFKDDPDDSDIRIVRFDTKARAEVAFGSPLILVSILLLVFNFIGLRYLLIIVPSIYLINVILAIFYPKIKIKDMYLKALVQGLFTFVLTYILFALFSWNHIWLYSLTLGLGISYLTMDFEGWSPLVKFDYRYNKVPEIEIDQDLCVACKQCIYVCPKGVFKFEEGIVSVSDPKACVMCKSCFRQCPVAAIIHSLDKTMIK